MQYVATFGLASMGAKLADLLSAHLGSFRWELPLVSIVDLESN
jgi:hypothetical protein